VLIERPAQIGKALGLKGLEGEVLHFNRGIQDSGIQGRFGR
jgi:hypothetical protein